MKKKHENHKYHEFAIFEIFAIKLTKKNFLKHDTKKKRHKKLNSFMSKSKKRSSNELVDAQTSTDDFLKRIKASSWTWFIYIYIYTYDVFVYSLKTNKFFWETPDLEAVKEDELAFPRETIAAIYENLLPLPPPPLQALPGDSVKIEEDPLDLAEAWKKYDRSDKSDEARSVVLKLIDGFRASFKQKLGDRAPYKFRGASLWQAILKTLQEQEVDVQASANLVFDLDVGEITDGSNGPYLLGPAEAALFSALDVYAVFEFCRIFPEKRANMYEPLIKALADTPTPLLYRGEKLDSYLKRMFPILSHAERQQSFALLFHQRNFVSSALAFNTFAPNNSKETLSAIFSKFSGSPA